MVVTDYSINDSGIAVPMGGDVGLPPREEVEVCKAWLTAFTLPTAAGDGVGWYSYGLKHTIEVCWPSIWGKDTKGYVSNGALLTAAQSLGLPIFHDKPTPNGWIGVKLKPEYKRAYRQSLGRGIAEKVGGDWLPEGVGLYGAEHSRAQ